MLNKLCKIRAHSQVIASVIQSSYFGIVVLLISYFFNKRAYLRVNSVYFGLLIFSIVGIFSFYLIIEYSSSSVSYIRTLALWMLPVIYYSLGSRGVNNKLYKDLLVVVCAYTIIEFILINLTSISFFDDDRLRTQIFGFIRSEGVSHNSSITSALIVSLLLKTYAGVGLGIKLFFAALVSIVFLGSGTGIILLLITITFFSLRNMIAIVLLSLVCFIIIFGYVYELAYMDYILNIHPKVSQEYIAFLIDLKYSQVVIFLESDIYHILFGYSIMENMVITSGDFGYLKMFFGLGVIPSFVILFFLIIIYIRASSLGNFAPFSIFMIASAHYPIFIDPISAYILAHYALYESNEK
jgi:hypothetical protein